jgi:hypothetical protein
VPVPAKLAVMHVASTFILVLNWWLDVAGARSPRDADALFHALVIPLFADGTLAVTQQTPGR